MSEPTADKQLVVAVTITGEPMSKERPRLAVTRGGKVYTPSATKHAERLVAWEIKKAFPRIEVNGQDAFRVELEFCLKSQRRRDLDNMTKLVLDACNKCVWKDDSQVEELEARLTRASVEPKTVIRIYSFPSSARQSRRKR